MHPIYDTDVLLLLAAALSAKRGPASLAAIVAALDVLHGSIPPEAKLADSFRRLGENGLLVASEGGFTLTPRAQEIMATQPKRASAAEQVFGLKHELALYKAEGAHAPIEVDRIDIVAAIKTHRAPVQGAGKNLLMPIRSKETENKRAGQHRRTPPRKRPA